MGLGRLFSRTTTNNRPVQARSITEFAIIDGVAVDGSGETGTRYRGGMSIPGAWRASLLISDLLGLVDWDATRVKNKVAETWDPRPPLLEQPAPPESRMSTFSSWALDLVWHGNAVGVWAARDGYGYPTAVYPVPAEQVGVRRITDNVYSPLPIGTIEYSIGSLRLAPWEVLHIKGPCEPGALKGMGVLEHHMTGGALGLAREQMDQAHSLARHGVPTGILRSTNPQDGVTELGQMKSQWLANQRARTIQAVNAATEFQPLSWNPEELQLVDARKYSLHEIALIFGLPLSFLGADQSSRTYSNIEQDAINLLKFTLGGHLARFEQTLSLVFPRGTEVVADLDKILRADTLTRYQAYAVGITAGVLEPNEARQKERMKPLPKPKPAPVVGADNEESTDDQQAAGQAGGQPVREGGDAGAGSGQPGQRRPGRVGAQGAQERA